MKLTDAQRRGLLVVATGERAGRPARRSDRTTIEAELEGARWFQVRSQTARQLIDRGLIRDELRPTGDGLYLTDAGRCELYQDEVS